MDKKFDPNQFSYSAEDLTSNITFHVPPNPVGYWIMPGSTAGWTTKFAAYKKPNILIRFSMKNVFGWVWEDEKKKL